MRKILHGVDEAITRSIQNWPKWLEIPMVFVTFLGQPFFTVGIALAIATYGLVKPNESLVLAGSIATITFGVCTLLKAFLKRKRPETEYVDKMYFDTFSFPSGHASGAIATYGLVAYFALALLAAPLSIIALISLSVLIFLIGISRIYLGAHYPSDVVGGWLLGAVGLYVIIHYIQPVI